MNATIETETPNGGSLHPAVSRQTAEQRKLKAEGRCKSCWQPINGPGVHCAKCRERIRIRVRKRVGCGKWQRGGLGRPPLEANYKAKRKPSKWLLAETALNHLTNAANFQMQWEARNHIEQAMIALDELRANLGG